MIDIPPLAAFEAAKRERLFAPQTRRLKGGKRPQRKPLARGGVKEADMEQQQQTGREGLLSLLFGSNDRVVRNVKFFRGNAANLALDDMCATAADVIRDTWEREATLADEPPESGLPKTKSR